MQQPARARSKSSRSMSRRWTVRSFEKSTATELGKSLKIHPAVARVLAARGWNNASACEEFLNPRLASLRDPAELLDMDRAVHRMMAAIKSGEKIGIFGDYDVDGVSSTALMLLTLRRLGADPVYFIPHRIHDGYGMSTARVEDLARQGIRLLITVDTGITAIEAISTATRLGMDVIVTDHHLAEGGMPEAAAIVNPNRPDSRYEFTRLCGVGVAFKFAHALLKGAGVEPGEARLFLRDLLDLVALGTIADVVPLLSENRVFARHGLAALADSKRPGIRALLREARFKGGAVGSETVGFLLGPRLNAAGRTEHASLALDLLLTDNEDVATELARKLDALNRRRREEEDSILTHSIEQADSQVAEGKDSFVVVAGEDYHLGVVGIVAARLVERFYRPAIVLRIDKDLARGSARSIPGFDVHQALAACSSHLVGYGGHAAAAGVRLLPEAVSGFRAAINEFSSDIFQKRDLSPEITVDAEVVGEELEWRLYDDLQKMQPFGEENPAPIFMLRGVFNSAAPRIVGTNHLKLSLRASGSSFSAIGFGLGDHLPICGSQSHALDILFRPVENTWQGRTSLELELVDLRPTA